MQRSATGTVIAILIGVTGLLFDTTAHAQYTADYQTNIISGVASNWAGNYILGYANNADVLVIESGGVMSNVNGYVGGPQFITNSVPIPGGSNDVAMVSGTGSVWNNSGDLYIGGGAGNNNLLIVTNGGAAYSVNGYVGNINGSLEMAVVTGSSSVWNNAGNLTVGSASGAQCSLIISDGGVVYDNEGVLSSDHGGPLALVTGSGSVWSNRNGFAITSENGGGSLIISNGGAVYDQSVDVDVWYHASVLVDWYRLGVEHQWRYHFREPRRPKLTDHLRRRRGVLRSR